MFTKEELEEMRLADEEIEAGFLLTAEDLVLSRRLDRQAELDRMDIKAYQAAAQQKAYREANREKIAAQQKAYREANREKIAAQKKAYYETNREKIAAQQKVYYETNRENLLAYQRAYYRAHKKKRRLRREST